MQFGSLGMNNADAGIAFNSTFGKAGIIEDSVYYDPIRKFDLRKEIGKRLYGGQLQKAPSIGNTTGGTVTVYGLMPSFIDPELVDRTVRETPLVRLLPRKAVRGRSYVYNAVTAKGGANFLPDDAALSEDEDTHTATSIQMKYLYAVGRVTNPALASAEGFLN